MRRQHDLRWQDTFDTSVAIDGRRTAIKLGDGASPAKGQHVKVQYTGWLTSGAKFDSTRDRNAPFDFVLGTGGVIKGWDIGVATMKVGGKRRLIIPGDLGYGARGSPPKIPANATLIFDVELLSVQP